MMRSLCARTLRVSGCAVALVLILALDASVPFFWRLSSAAAEAAPAEKAFEAAKSLGTVDAWEAFLTAYPTGFHADLARAYIKKLGEGAPAAATPPDASAPNDFPTAAGSWGGIVRDGPGQDHRKLDSLDEGEPVTLLERSVVVDGYPWFKISYRGGRIGYKWGGILCSTGAERPDLFKTCAPASEAVSGVKDTSAECKKSGGEWDGRRCQPAGFFDEPTKKKTQPAKKKKKCPTGQYLNQNGVCQPDETGG